MVKNAAEKIAIRKLMAADPSLKYTEAKRLNQQLREQEKSK